jgi:hypothetical protein
MAEEKGTLDKEAEDYLRALPGLKYPQALVDQFPRIANKIYELKDDKTKLRAYFDELANDSRGGRKGFEFGVLMNIQDMREVIVGDNTGFVLNDTTKWVS